MLKVLAKKSNSATVLCLEGQIINGETEILRNAVQSAAGASEITLNLANVRVVDAHGLGVLLQIREQAQARGMKLELMNVGKHLRELFRMTRLDSVFQIRSGVEFLPRFAPSRVAA